MLHPWLRRISLAIGSVWGAAWLWSFVFEVAKRRGWIERPGETVEALNDFLQHLWALPGVSLGALLGVGFVIGVCADAFLRRLDGSRVQEGAHLGRRMEELHWEMTKDLEGLLAVDHRSPRKSWAETCQNNRPAILSVQAHAKRVGIWVPGGSLDHVEGNALVMQYFREVGRLLSDKHFTDAKSRAKAFQNSLDRPR